MGKARLKIVPFHNRSGSVSFRVTGTINGVRYRRNWPTKSEAEADLEKHTGRILGETTPRHARMTG